MNRRGALFRLAALAIPLLAFGAVEGAVRFFGPAAPDDPRLGFSDLPRFFEEVEIDGVPHLRAAHDELYRGRGTVFPVAKPPGTVRILCLGGSASAGWPLPAEHSYPAILQRALEQADPGRRFEVLNLGAHAYAAYRVHLVLDQTLPLDPDAVVVMSGNNEFLEPRTYRAARGLAALGEKLATVRLLRRLATGSGGAAETLSGRRRQGVLEEQWSKVKRVALDLRKEPGQLREVERHYEERIESMVEKAAERGVPVVLVTVPVNLSDWLPNVSFHEIPEDSEQAWRERFRAGRRAALEGDRQAAAAAFEEALEISPGHAETHFRLARALEAAGDLDAAFEHYRRAKEEDHNPFRALDAFNDSLREAASRHSSANLAGAERAFREASAPRAPGFDLFLDYVHPTRRGNQLLAETVFETLAALPSLDLPAVPFPGPPAETLEGGYDETRDPTVQRTLLWLYGMMHQYEALLAAAARYEALPGADLRLARQARNTFGPWLEVERRDLLGLPVGAERRQKVEASFDRYYREHYRLEEAPGRR